MSSDVKWNAVLQSGEWWHEVDLTERDKLQLNWVVIRSNDVGQADTPPVWLSLDVLPELFIHNCGWCTNKTWCDGCEALGNCEYCLEDMVLICSECGNSMCNDHKTKVGGVAMCLECAKLA